MPKIPSRIKPTWQTEGVRLYLGDSFDIILGLKDIDTVVTDPPYGLGFMSKSWDYVSQEWHERWATLLLKVCKPGTMLLAFGGTRTFHRIACAIEDAGWEIRDTIMYLYGSGMPKSLDISKAIDKKAGAERKVIGKAKGVGKQNPSWNGTAAGRKENSLRAEYDLTAPTTDLAQQWEGWGTALKPAFEPIVLAMKSLDGTFAANAETHGVAGLWIDGARVQANGDKLGGGRVSTKTEGWDRPWKHNADAIEACRKRGVESVARAEKIGRWPANVLHDGSEEVVVGFPIVKGQIGGNNDPRGSMGYHGGAKGVSKPGVKDSGSAARFFYTAKASKRERGEGNKHPTVKPLALMQYLVRLTKTPKGGTVLDPFMGSGTTGVACIREGRQFIGIERDEESFWTAVRRIENASKT